MLRVLACVHVPRTDRRALSLVRLLGLACCFVGGVLVLYLFGRVGVVMGCV